MFYEKAYKEALERARIIRLQLLDIGEEATEIEHIFPELKEGEDENIRKEMIYVFKQLNECTTICGRHYDYVKWIAWLEKQKPMELSK